MYRRYAARGEVTKKVVGCISCIYDLLILYGLEENLETQADFRHTVDHWTDQISRMGGDWMKFAKYKLASFVHARTDQMGPAPEAPVGIKAENPKFLITGQVGRFLKKITLPSSPVAAEVIAGVGLGVKKGMPRPGKDYLDKGAKASYIALTTTRPDQPDIPDLDVLRESKLDAEAKKEGKAGIDWNDYRDAKYENCLSRRTTRIQVRRIVHELFYGHKYDHWLKSRRSRQFPSTSSTNTSSRSDGGGFADVQSYAKRFGFFDSEKPLMKFSVFSGHEESLLEGMALGRMVDLMLDDEALAEPPTTVFNVNYVELYAQYDHLYDHAAATYLNETLTEGKWNVGEQVWHYGYDGFDNEVDIVALSEALKVRTITKGNGMRNFLLQPLQSFLWSRLRAHPIFALIGEPLTEQHILNVLGGRLKAGEAYLSGDYSAATDNLAPWFSEMIAEEIAVMCDLPGWLTELFRQALTKHMIRDPDSEEVKPQQWGQLMGSLVSFPILCIANAIVCRWTLEHSHNRRMNLKDVRMLINGDDCVFKIKTSALPVWEAIAKYHGLAPSVGKYFLSRTLIQMNSVNFTVEEFTHDIWYFDEAEPYSRPCPFRLVKYINFGLLYGFGRSVMMLRKRKGEEIKDDESLSPEDIINLGSRAHDLLRFAPIRLQESVYGLFLERHNANLSKQAGGLSWFAPKSYGGLGLPSFQMRPKPDLATNNASLEKFDSLLERGLLFESWTSVSKRWQPSAHDMKLIGYMIDNDMTMPLPKGDSSMPIREAAATFIPLKMVYTEFEYDDKAVDAQACLETLFRKVIKPRVISGTTIRVLNKNAHRWQKLTKTGCFGQPRSLLTLLQERFKPRYPVYLEDDASVPRRFRVPFSQLELGFQEMSERELALLAPW